MKRGLAWAAVLAATWYDPATGSTVSSSAVSAGTTTLSVPPFVLDAVLFIKGE